MAAQTQKIFRNRPGLFYSHCHHPGGHSLPEIWFCSGHPGILGSDWGDFLLGHLVTIPTALAISEIATNKRVEGGGEYFIISRSFGLNIGATIGFALFYFTGHLSGLLYHCLYGSI